MNPIIFIFKNGKLKVIKVQSCGFANYLKINSDFEILKQDENKVKKSVQVPYCTCKLELFNG